MFQRYVYILMLIIPFVANSQHIIKGYIKGSTDNFTVYLKEFTNYDWVVLDSTIIKDNKFEFTIRNNEKLICIDSKNDTKFHIKLYNVKGITEVNYDFSNNTYNLTGTSKNEGFSNFENFLKPYRDKLAEISQQKPKIANPSSFTIDERNAYLKHFISEKEAKNDIELVKFDFIKNNRTNEYTKVLIAEKLNTVFNEKDYDLLETFYDRLNQNDKESDSGKKLALFLKEYQQVKIGTKVTNFTLPDTKNKQQTLYKNLGKYTIIYFWASWCGPCRLENPNTVALYNKYQKKGLKIIGISLDTDQQKWISAIEKDNLTWLQLSNLTGWKEPLLQNFKVTSIPKLIILDKNGAIIAKDLRGKELAKKIEELFGKK